MYSTEDMIMDLIRFLMDHNHSIMITFETTKYIPKEIYESIITELLEKNYIAFSKTIIT